MEKKIADYISRIEIESMWGRKHIVWNLRPDVNILSGVNGVGKSTILNNMASALRSKAKQGEYENGDIPGVKMTFEPEDAMVVHYDVIRSFDNTMISGSVIN